MKRPWVLTDLDRSYWATPPGELFAVARAYRWRVDQLIHHERYLQAIRQANEKHAPMTSL